MFFRRLISMTAIIGAAAAACPLPSFAAPAVDDRAGLFSATALSEASRTVADIYERTAPHKEVLITTVPTLPSGISAEARAEELFRERRLDGVLLFVVRDPHKLVVTVGKKTEERFDGKDGVRRVMLESFRRSDFDGGLTAGLSLLHQQLLTEFPKNQALSLRGARHLPGVESASVSAGQFSWWPLVIVGFGIFLVVRLFTKRRRPQFPNAPGQIGSNMPYGSSGFGGGSEGGGFGRGLLGGVLGAVGGSWLYDRFRGGGDFGNSYGATRDNNFNNDASASDDGDVGSSTSDTWADGGNDSSGGDFGGGGGDSGGGSDW